MSTCLKCETIGSSNEPLASCDRCNAVLCKTCASLTSTELRAISLQKRSISFFCSDCQSLQSNSSTLSDLQCAIGVVVKEELSTLLDSIVKIISADLRSKLDLIHNEVLDLKQLNLDLTKSLTEGQKTPPSVHRGDEGATSAGLSHSSSPTMSTHTLVNKQQSFISSQNPGQSVGVPSGGLLQPDPRRHVQQTSASSGGSSRPPRSSLQPASASVHGPAQLQYSPVMGSRKLSNSKVAAAKIVKKTSIYVGRLDMQVSKDDLLSYLRSTFGDDESFTLQEQKVRSGDYRSFRVEARLDLLDKLLCASNWPEDILVKKFRFFRQRPLPSS